MAQDLAQIIIASCTSPLQRRPQSRLRRHNLTNYISKRHPHSPQRQRSSVCVARDQQIPSSFPPRSCAGSARPCRCAEKGLAISKFNPLAVDTGSALTNSENCNSHEFAIGVTVKHPAKSHPSASKYKESLNLRCPPYLTFQIQILNFEL